MEESINFDKYIQIASWIAMGGLIISAIGVFAFRHYTGKKNSATSIVASNERQDIQTKLDTEFQNTKKEIEEKKDSILSKLNTSFEGVELQITEESNKYLNSLRTLNKDIQTAHESLTGQLNTFQNLVDFDAFVLEMTISASSTKGIEHFYNGLYGQTTIVFEFYQEIDSKSIKVIAEISDLPGIAGQQKNLFFSKHDRKFYFTNQKFTIRGSEGELESIRIDMPITLNIKPYFSPNKILYFNLSYGQGKAYRIISGKNKYQSNVTQEIVMNNPYNYLQLELNN